MMQNTTKKPSFRCVVIIVDANIRDKVSEFMAESRIPIFYQMHGVGTASSEFLNLCGLGDTHKNITICFVPTESTQLILAEMNHALQLHRKGTGIAISIPISGIPGFLFKLLDEPVSGNDSAKTNSEREIKNMSETITHALLLITVSQGFSEDIMSTARAAGATGGTIMRGLRNRPKEVAKRFGISIQEEQEIVLIVVPQEKRTEILSAITTQHGPGTPAHGIAISLPVDGIAGI